MFVFTVVLFRYFTLISCTTQSPMIMKLKNSPSVHQAGIIVVYGGGVQFHCGQGRFWEKLSSAFYNPWTPLFWPCSQIFTKRDYHAVAWAELRQHLLSCLCPEGSRLSSFLKIRMLTPKIGLWEPQK